MRIKSLQIVCHLGIFGAVFAVVFWLSIHVLVTEKKPVQVPVLIGKSWHDAKEDLVAVGLEAKVNRRVPDFFAPPGTVLVQDVLAGEVVPEGREVYLALSKGFDPDWKQNVVALPLAKAQQYLQAQQVTYVSVYHTCSSLPSNLILAASWDQQSKKMSLLLEDQACRLPSVLKDVQQARYIEAFRREVSANGMQLRLVGKIGKNDKVVTDPLPGSIVSKDDFIVLRKE